MPENSVPIGPSMQILQINVEGLSLAKCEVLSKLADDYDVDVLLLQETHLKHLADLNGRCRIKKLFCGG